MSAPFGKVPGAQRLHPWSGQVRIPKGHNFTKWRGPKGQRVESIAEAADRKDPAVRALNNGTSTQAILSKVYEVCWDEEPCGLQMEPLCCRRLRINFVGRASKAITTHCSGKRLWWVTLVPLMGKCAPDQLHTMSLEKIVKYVRRKLVAAGCGHLRVIGAVDISYNENSEGEWKPHWQFHVHCVIAGGTEAKLKKKLKKVFPRTETIRKPVEVEPVTNLMGALSYCCKSYFERRVSYINNKGHWDTNGDLPIKAPEFREISLFMATQSVSSRFLFQGFRRRGRYLEPTS